MNFFKHHIGDYAAATQHLSWEEDMAYTRLLRVYYRDEKPLPKDPEKCARLVHASCKKHRRIVAQILAEFFELRADGWHNKRADQEIGAMQCQITVNKRIAHEREQKRKQKIKEISIKSMAVAHESLNQSLNEPSNQSLHDSSTNSARFVNLSISHKPDSRIQNEEQRPEKNSEQNEEPQDLNLSPAPTLEARKSKKRTRLGSRIPVDFSLTDERRAYALKHHVDAERAFEMFCTYWRSKSTAATKLDWDATWQHWVLKDADRHAPRKTRFDELTERLGVTDGETKIEL